MPPTTFLATHSQPLHCLFLIVSTCVCWCVHVFVLHTMHFTGSGSWVGCSTAPVARTTKCCGREGRRTLRAQWETGSYGSPPLLISLQALSLCPCLCRGQLYLKGHILYLWGFLFLFFFSLFLCIDDMKICLVMHVHPTICLFCEGKNKNSMKHCSQTFNPNVCLPATIRSMWTSAIFVSFSLALTMEEGHMISIKFSNDYDHNIEKCYVLGVFIFFP